MLYFFYSLHKIQPISEYTYWETQKMYNAKNIPPFLELSVPAPRFIKIKMLDFHMQKNILSIDIFCP